jgi:hypothetical protein
VSEGRKKREKVERDEKLKSEKKLVKISCRPQPNYIVNYWDIFVNIADLRIYVIFKPWHGW